MGRDKELEARIAANPEQQLPVVITLAKGAEADISALGLTDARELLPGIYSGTFSGKQIQELLQRDDVDEVQLDFEVGTL